MTDFLKVQLKAVGDELANTLMKLDLIEEMHQKMRKEILSQKALNGESRNSNKFTHSKTKSNILCLENLNMELQKSNKFLCEKEEEIEDFKMNYELSVKENESLSTQISKFLKRNIKLGLYS